MTDTTISEDLKAAIAKNLPSMVAGEMQEFIKQAEIKAAELINTKRMLDEAAARVSALSAENSKFKASADAVTARETAVSAREAAVLGVEHTLEIAKLRTDLANDKVAFVSGVHDKIFGNRVVRESNLEAIPFQQLMPTYQNGMPSGSVPTGGIVTGTQSTTVSREEG